MASCSTTASTAAGWAASLMGLFAAGPQGAWVARDERTELRLVPEDIGGPQTVPLIVLVGPDTVSYGEILAGVLRLAGRATVMGPPTNGNVEQLRAYDLPDGSRAWLASAAFQPRGDATGIWEADRHRPGRGRAEPMGPVHRGDRPRPRCGRRAPASALNGRRRPRLGSRAAFGLGVGFFILCALLLRPVDPTPQD